MALIAWSIPGKATVHKKATVVNIFYSTALRPPICLHVALHKVSSQLAASLCCLMIGWELSGGDGLWCWCIYLLCADRKLFSCPDWLGLITAASIPLFNRVRLGRVCLLTRWDVHEDERKTFLNLGWHWRLGKHSSSLFHLKWIKRNFLWDKECCSDILNTGWHCMLLGWKLPSIYFFLHVLGFNGIWTEDLLKKLYFTYTKSLKSLP